ncbi:MAG: helix-turn-helix transcriptional regulator [Ignavibacteriales bacterium]|nr:helix-turn-helix transcriptional regulator [Ignavibacteriales bacterium]
MQILAENIALVRNKLEKTQQEIAEIFGVTVTTVANWEKNRRTPDIEILVELSQMAKVSLDWLITGKIFKDEAIEDRLNNIEKKFEERITKLEAENYRYIKLVEEKENKIAELEGQLLVRFALAGELDKKLKK